MIKRFILATVCIFMMISVIMSGCASNTKDDKICGFEGSNGGSEGSVGGSENSFSSSEGSNDSSEGSYDTPDSQSKYQVLVYGYSDSVPMVKHEKEYEFADREKYDFNEIKNYVELSVGENAYRGNFKRSQYRGCNYFPTYMYVDSEKNNFEIDPSGMLTCVFRGKSSSEGDELPQEEYLRIAKNFLGGIIDISPYDISIEYKSDSQIYVIEFKKYINGIKTTDTATVSLNINGELYMYSSFMLGKVTPEHVPESIDLGGIKEAVNQKLDLLFADAKKYYSRVEYGEPIFRLTVLKDGSAAIECTVDVDCIESFPNYEMSMGEKISFVVKID